MSRILIVDDEHACRTVLERTLRSEGHEVLTAASGREGIDVGARFRPDLLVVDWRLGPDLHGLEVVAALRAVKPDLQSILITGFASRELHAAAERAPIFELVSKPFEPEEILALARRALVREECAPYRAAFGVLEIDASRSIRYASPRAHELFAETNAGRDASDLDELIDAPGSIDLAASRDRWLAIRPRCRDGGELWKIRSQGPASDGSRILVLLRDGEDVHHPQIATLLGTRELPSVHRAPRRAHAGAALALRRT